MHKLAIYTIALNEEQFVERFMASVSEADQVFVLDTGSTDKTVQALRDLGAIVETGVVRPWRFDVPRQASLAMVSRDFKICMSVDLDETLTPGWAQEIKHAWTPTTTRMRYQYAWSHNADDSPATCFWYDKIHQRENYRWVKPVHEILTIYNEPEVQTYCHNFMLHHYPDTSKSRSSYLPLLELAVREEPWDDRSAHYLGREYMYYGKFNEAITELKRHLALPSATWQSERAASMRFISRCYRQLDDMTQALAWARQACELVPNEREPWFDLCRLGYLMQKWDIVITSAHAALQITERGQSYISDPEAWSYIIYDYLAIAYWHTGNKALAYEQGLKALQVAELLCDDATQLTRLRTNLDFYHA
jgi:glycosyltransferase involved in cell wall biosynthesis